MKIVIIEDEPLTAEDLARCIVKAQPDAIIVAILSSVREAIQYFKENAEPDLIFSDIQLGDGLSFKVFDEVLSVVPVIFCTAYDEYALNAFRSAGIDYILKPFTTKAIASALEKYNKLKERLIISNSSYGLAALADNMMRQQNSILVNYKDKIIPVKFTDIALFNIRNELTYLHTFSKEEHFIGKTLEEIENIVPAEFYRVSRQHIVNQKAIKDISQYFGRKLLLNLNIAYAEKITVSKAKSGDFLAWLSGK